MKSWLDLLVDDKDYEDNARPDFLKNPLTEQNLEYDRYYRRGVAFEFNGPQHYGPTERYPNKRGARERRARDLVKKALSIENGVQLVIVHSQDLTPANMVAKIGNLLPLREFDPNDPYGTALHKASRAYIRRVAGRSI
ncbi:MAG: hypothetical protein HPY71_03500 [Firmicutes bacterium]|nr:hypothetical protein [Bacillota bacterium]